MPSVPLTVKLTGPLLMASVCAFTLTGCRAKPPTPTTTVNRPAEPGAILFYQDPMHPSYRSDKPGKAPDCGMDLEPVYAAPSAIEGPRTSALSVQVSDTAADLIGLRTERVRSESATGQTRALGQVVADESRVYRVTALADGVIREVDPLGTGSPVVQNQHLATYFVPARDLYNAVQAYILANGTYDQVASSVNNNAVIRQSKAQARVEEELLRSYGVTTSQLHEMSRTREVTRDVDFRSPVSGIVLDRSASSGQAVSRGAEVFRIADLRRVWVLADVYESDAALFPAGRAAQISYGDQTFRGVVSSARTFDAASRTLKVRIDVDNPAQTLRPDMFVHVNMQTRGSTMLSVPSDSVLDSGERKTVFVSTAPRTFVARQVTTGREHDGRIEVLTGLEGGEEVVSQAAFLLDSESRLNKASQETSQTLATNHSRTSALATSSKTEAKDPVCGMPLGDSESQITEQVGGRRYFFCSRKCRNKFKQDRSRYMLQAPEVGL